MRLSRPNRSRQRAPNAVAPAVWLVASLLATACGRPGDARAAAGSPAAADAAPAPDTSARSALPVDSFVPIEEALRRFRAPLGPAPTRLTGGAPDREQLARDFVRAAARRDTAAFNRMIVSRAEFAWLYYPTSAVRQPPYELDPQMAWFQLRTQSEKGIGRVLDRLGGAGLTYRGLDCPPTPRREGANRVWEGCVVRYAREGRKERQRLFGTIVARGGVHKFVGYGNDF